MTLWALTTYFNPIRYRSRLQNFRLFRRALVVPLVTVELGYDDRFDLTPEDSDVVIRVTANDLLWQKERLLNLALASVPADVNYVAWLDCDLVLQRPDWPEAAIALLRTKPLVQLFSDLHDLAQGELPPPATDVHELTGHGIAHLLASGRCAVTELAPTVVPARSRQRAWGLAWAARKTILVQHGFYDALVVGSGDRALTYAAYGQLASAVSIMRMNQRQRAHYVRWADAFYRSVRGKVGCVEGRLFHLWHGDFKNRRYRERHEEFAAYEFDPTTDLVVNPSGAYEWAAHRRDLANFSRRYFVSRLEDGSAPFPIDDRIVGPQQQPDACAVAVP